MNAKHVTPAAAAQQRYEGETPTVFVIDDDVSVREGLTDLIASIGLNVQAFHSAQEFLTKRPVGAFGCIVLDVCMPGMTGLDLQKELNAADESLPIIFLTGRGDIPMTVEALKAGAAHFLTKPVRAGELIEAVNQALEANGRTREERNKLSALRRRLEDLSPRERDVMALVVSGLPNKQIAWELRISERTVKLHRGQVMRKMGTESLPELVKIAERLGFPAPASATARKGVFLRRIS